MRKPESIKDGIFIFDSKIIENHPDYNFKTLETLHHVEEDHFWFLSRKKRILSVFNRYVPKNKMVLEIGAGSGNVSKALIEDGYNVSVAEMHLSALHYARKYGINNCYQFDLLDPPFIEHFDVIGMFDVLEHLSDDLFALQKIYTMLKSDGLIILTVPAFNLLWSRDDAYGHKRRYRLKYMKSIIEKAGFKILYARYYFSVILPLLLIRRLVKPDNGTPASAEEFDIKMNFLLNSFLLILTSLENKLSPITPNFPGGSIITVAAKCNGSFQRKHPL